MVLQVFVDQQIGRFPSQGPGGRRWHGAAVHGIEISPGGQNIEPSAGWRARRGGGDEFPIKRCKQPLRLHRATSCHLGRDALADMLHNLRRLAAGRVTASVHQSLCQKL